MSSTIDKSIAPLKPAYHPEHGSMGRHESAKISKLISALRLMPHIEGGYFVETDRDPLKVPNPFLTRHFQNNATNTTPQIPGEEATTTFYTSTGAVSADLSDKLNSADQQASDTVSSSKDGQDVVQGNDTTRNASTSIFYFLSPETPLGAFHRNRGRTVHTLHKGRGRYVILHADEVMPSYDSHAAVESKARIETFVVGQDVEAGERLQWIVEGGKYKASFLLDEEGKEGESEGLLISETVVPGFEYGDHDFMRSERLQALVTKEQYDEMEWMLRKDVNPL